MTAHKPVGVVAVAAGRDQPLRPLRWLARDEFREPGVEVAFEVFRALAALLAPKPGDLGEAQPVSIRHGPSHPVTRAACAAARDERATHLDAGRGTGGYVKCTNPAPPKVQQFVAAHGTMPVLWASVLAKANKNQANQL
jgi:hypothetical protein